MRAKRILTSVGIVAALIIWAAPGDAHAAGTRARGPQRAPVADPGLRDCTPVNGPHGYYGNAWCDGGFLTLEEQEYRYAKRLDIDHRGLRYRPGRRRLIEAR